MPRGFAHGFSVLSETAIFAYKCDNNYNKESEGGLKYDDPALAIDWQIPADKMSLSDKDLVLPYLTTATKIIKYERNNFSRGVGNQVASPNFSL